MQQLPHLFPLRPQTIHGHWRQHGVASPPLREEQLTQRLFPHGAPPSHRLLPHLNADTLGVKAFEALNIRGTGKCGKSSNLFNCCPRRLGAKWKENSKPWLRLEVWMGWTRMWPNLLSRGRGGGWRGGCQHLISSTQVRQHTALLGPRAGFLGVLPGVWQRALQAAVFPHPAVEARASGLPKQCPGKLALGQRPQHPQQAPGS